jgi:hypothetical protein
MYYMVRVSLYSRRLPKHFNDVCVAGELDGTQRAGRGESVLVSEGRFKLKWMVYGDGVNQ